MKNLLNIQPPQRIYNVFKHLNYRYWYALGEFVDNSIESYLKNKDQLRKINKNYNLKIEIDIDQSKKEITIKDNAGGISKKDIARAFTPAVQPEEKGLSEFGMGMKAAGCWFCDRWIVSTKHFNEEFERTVDFDLREIVDKDLKELKYVSKKIKNKSSYTKVFLKKVSQFPHTNSINKIKNYLSSIYRLYLRDKEIEIYVNGERLDSVGKEEILYAPNYKKIKKAFDRILAKDIMKYSLKELKSMNLKNLHKYDAEIKKKDYEIWKREINFEFYGKKVIGFIGLLATQGPSRSGLFLTRKKRVIVSGGYRPEEIFKGPNSQEYQRIFGELALDDFKVTHTKDNINWEGKEDEFIRKLISELNKKDFLKQARHYRPRFIEDKKVSLLEKFMEESAKKAVEAEAAEKRAVEAEADAKSARKRELFTKKLLSEDKSDIIKLQHQIDICTSDIQESLLDLKERIQSGEKIDNEELKKDYIAECLKENQKISSIVKIVTNANYDLESKEITDDLISFIKEYLEKIPNSKLKKIKISFDIKNKEVFTREFIPLEIIIILDNLINNSEKHGAKEINIKLKKSGEKLIFDFSDNGKGVPKKVIKTLFELGETTTNGSGIGLYHIKEIMEEMEGSVELLSQKNPTTFRMTF